VKDLSLSSDTYAARVRKSVFDHFTQENIETPFLAEKSKKLSNMFSAILRMCASTRCLTGEQVPLTLPGCDLNSNSKHSKFLKQNRKIAYRYKHYLPQPHEKEKTR
jgi:hypothetical protein